MIELHQKLLKDSRRNRALHDALKKVIKPGHTAIADIGSGTGFLSFLASKLGAKQCYLYEFSELLDVSKKIAQENGIKNCQFFHAHSTSIKKPPLVNIIISETLGTYALEENIIETLEDAKRFLKPDGIIIPGKIEQFIAPIISPRIMKDINVWDDIGFNLKFTAAKHGALNNMYVEKITPVDFEIKHVQRWDTIDFTKKNSSIRRAKVSWQCDKKQAVYGFGLWWKSELIPGVSLSTSPFDSPTHWDQIFLPLTESITAEKNDRLEISLISDSRYTIGINVAWETQLFDKNNKKKAAIKMDMLQGL